jgi:hypothetical protein
VKRWARSELMNFQFATAIPLFELYDNTARYGPQLAALVTALSK